MCRLVVESLIVNMTSAFESVAIIIRSRKRLSTRSAGEAQLPTPKKDTHKKLSIQE